MQAISVKNLTGEAVVHICFQSFEQNYFFVEFLSFKESTEYWRDCSVIVFHSFITSMVAYKLEGATLLLFQPPMIICKCILLTLS